MGASHQFDYATSTYIDFDLGTSISDWPFSFGGWVYWDENLSSGGDAFCTLATGTNMVQLTFQTDTTFRYVMGQGTTANVAVDIVSSIAVGSWYHIMYVDRSATDHEVFINGVSKSTDSTDLGTFQTLEKLRLGNIVGTVREEFKGKMAFWEVWTKALNVDEVNEVMRHPYSIPQNWSAAPSSMTPVSALSDWKDMSGQGGSATAGTLPSPSSSGPPVSFPTMITSS